MVLLLGSRRRHWSEVEPTLPHRFLLAAIVQYMLHFINDMLNFVI